MPPQAYGREHEGYGLLPSVADRTGSCAGHDSEPAPLSNAPHEPRYIRPRCAPAVLPGPLGSVDASATHTTTVPQDESRCCEQHSVILTLLVGAADTARIPDRTCR